MIQIDDYRIRQDNFQISFVIGNFDNVFSDIILNGRRYLLSNGMIRSSREG